MRADSFERHGPETDLGELTAELVPHADFSMAMIDYALGSLKIKELRELIVLLEAVASDINPLTPRPLYPRRDLIRRRRRR